jgi:uncharacterized protein YbjQ (UPF0145 family)
LGLEGTVPTIRKIFCSVAAVGALALLAVVPASAADDIIALDLQQALNAPDTLAHIDGSVKFYFGTTTHPAIVKHLGEAVTNKKANGFGRNSTRGCERAFLDGLIAFQEKAKALGANAVIGINSYYKKNEVAIDKTVECHSGLLMDGIAMKGEFVKLAK